MIDNILNLLQLANEEGWRGKHIDIARGKNKFPETIREMVNQKRYEKS